MRQVIDIHGVYFPTLLLLGILALVALQFIGRGLAAIGFYRFVWHRPLFDAALFVSLLSLFDLALRWLIP